MAMELVAFKVAKKARAELRSRWQRDAQALRDQGLGDLNFSAWLRKALLAADSAAEAAAQSEAELSGENRVLRALVQGHTRLLKRMAAVGVEGLVHRDGKLGVTRREEQLYLAEAYRRAAQIPLDGKLPSGYERQYLEDVLAQLAAAAEVAAEPAKQSELLPTPPKAGGPAAQPLAGAFG